MNISEVFEQIIIKPELYLGTVSITRLWAYLKGYIAALQTNNILFDDREFGDFCKWVDIKYNFKTTNSCAEIILFVSFGDEHRAIETAKALWIEYKNQKE